jgi:phospholipase C
MTVKQWWKSTCATLAVTSLMAQPAFAASGDVSLGAPSSPIASQYAINPASEPVLPQAVKLALIRQKIKYVFVIFQENRAFDHYFGTFPKVDGLFNQPSSQILGFTQKIVNTNGTVGTITPFLIPQTVKTVAAGTAGPAGTSVPLYPADTASTDHSHAGMNNSLDINKKTLLAANDRYALDEEGLTTNASGQVVSESTGVAATTPPTLAQKQMGELAVSHIDCDTIPFLWQYADRFALFDAFHQTVIGPSTPNAIALIAGQSGLTQWALHPTVASSNTSSASVKESGGEPIVGDPGPFPGSNLDPSAVKPPYNPGDENPATPALDQTYASLPLSFMGGKIKQVLATDQNPNVDLADVQADITLIAGENLPPTNWAWYQEGFDADPTATPPNAVAGNAHSDFIVHHEGPQYFGYVADNPQVAQQHLFGQGGFYTALSQGTLAAKGGVYYVRGGYGNLDGLTPADPNPTVRSTFPGNDDHPGYSDAQISEASVADTVNAIAASKYWSQSAIVITYDETDGLRDHQQVGIRALDPEGNPVENGPRIPAIVVSPYASAHVIVHQPSEHSSVIKFIDELFGLAPLADLPNELYGRLLGYFQLGQLYLSPADDGVSNIGDLFPAFDNERLLGTAAPLPASYAMIDPTIVHTLPHYASAGGGCKALDITPTDYTANGTVIDPAPADFNPRPGTNPGTPTSGNWTP